MDYSKKDQMFDQAKNPLRKFFGERISMTAVKQECEGVNITKGGLVEEEITGRKKQIVLL